MALSSGMVALLKPDWRLCRTRIFIVRIAQFVRDGFFGGAGANGTAESGMGQVQEWIRERYPGVLGWRVLL